MEVKESEAYLAQIYTVDTCNWVVYNFVRGGIAANKYSSVFCKLTSQKTLSRTFKGCVYRLLEIRHGYLIREQKCRYNRAHECGFSGCRVYRRDSKRNQDSPLPLHSCIAHDDL